MAVFEFLACAEHFPDFRTKSADLIPSALQFLCFRSHLEQLFTGDTFGSAVKKHATGGSLDEWLLVLYDVHLVFGC